MAFSAHVYSGQSNRNAFLLVNVKASQGCHEIGFSIEERAGSVYFDDKQTERMKIKVVTKDMIMDDDARIPIAFFGTDWGQHAELRQVRPSCRLESYLRSPRAEALGGNPDCG